jgi:hypothetical protein
MQYSTMAKVKFKYAINHHLNLIPREVSIDDILKILKKHGINKVTFYRDRNLTDKSESSIPSDRLVVYSKLFDCTLDDLLNYDIKVASIQQRLNKKHGVKKIKNGLS